MTTQTWVSAIAHTTDADFRAWGSELSTKLAAAGLVQHTDTGQINWTTVARPGASTAGGFEIWRFNDALQGTAPIFMKVEYGTGTNAAYPQMWLTVGTATNGSGTLTGTAVTSRNTICFTGSCSVGNWASYLCVAEGHVGLAFKVGATANASGGHGFFVIARTTDTSGAPTADGFVTFFGSLDANTRVKSQPVRSAATAAAYTLHDVYSIVPGAVVGSLVGSDIQVFPVLSFSPRVFIMPTLAVALLSEIPAGTQFVVAMVGATGRTFLSVGGGNRATLIGSAGPGNLASYGFAMLWE